MIKYFAVPVHTLLGVVVGVYLPVLSTLERFVWMLMLGSMVAWTIWWIRREERPKPSERPAVKYKTDDLPIPYDRDSILPGPWRDG